MQLTDYITGKTIEIAAAIVTEMHTRGPFTEIKTGINIDGIVYISTYKVKEPVPVVMDMIRSESTT